MGYLLLWIESLASGLLLLAATAAVVCRLERRWLRWLICGAVAAPLLASSVALVEITRTLEVERHFVQSWFSYTLSWAIGLLLGTLLIELAVLWPRDKPLACSWSTPKLTIGTGAVVALLLATIWSMDSAAQLQLAALRAEVAAMDLAADSPHPTDGDNAAIEYLEACDLFARNGPLPAAQQKAQHWLDPSQPLDLADPDLQEFRSWNTAALEWVRRGAAKPACYFDRGPIRSRTVISEVAQLRDLARCLELEARCAARAGDLERALADCATLLNLARHLCADRVLAAFVVAATCEEQAARILDLVLTSGRPTVRELSCLQDLEHPSYKSALRRLCSHCQRSGLRTLATDPDEWLGEVADAPLPALARGSLSVPPLWRLFLLPEDLHCLREQTDKKASRLALPYPAALQDLECTGFG